jgi:uncharacterized protein (UPF0332 family)
MQYRLEQARECLVVSERDLNAESFKAAANRSYYCIFHSMRSVLAQDSFDSKKHTGVISAFRQKYIKPGVFPVELSDIIRDAFNIRGKSDYEDFFVISKEDVVQQIENARVFLEAVEAYINSLLRY